MRSKLQSRMSAFTLSPPPILQVVNHFLGFRSIVELAAQLAHGVTSRIVAGDGSVVVVPPEVGEVLLGVVAQKTQVLGQGLDALKVLHLDVGVRRSHPLVMIPDKQRVQQSKAVSNELFFKLTLQSYP